MGSCDPESEVSAVLVLTEHLEKTAEDSKSSCKYVEKVQRFIIFFYRYNDIMS